MVRSFPVVKILNKSNNNRSELIPAGVFVVAPMLPHRPNTFVVRPYGGWAPYSLSGENIQSPISRFLDFFLSCKGLLCEKQALSLE